jgi:hypothetical protein
MAIWNTAFLTGALLILALGGCASPALVGDATAQPEPLTLTAQVEALRDRMCACTDDACARAVQEAIADFERANHGVRVTGQVHDAMTAALREAGECLMRVWRVTTPPVQE